VGRQPGPEPVAGREEVGFEDRLEHDLRRRHNNPVGHGGNPERTELVRSARFRDVNPPQRPRPIRPGTQPRGKLIEEVAYPASHDVLDGDPIDPRGSAVGTDLAPSPPEHVAAGDLVTEGVEAAIPILLSTAVEHALESTNPVHALGAADGSSRFGTHQSPSHPSRASMKCGPFPMWPAFPTSEYYDPLRLPLDHPGHFPGSPVIGRASLPATPQTGGAETALPSSQDDHPHVQRPIRRRVHQRPLLDQERLPWPSPSRDRLGSLYSRPQAGPLDDACSGFTCVADRAVAPAPLRTRPLDHARGLHYRGPRRLPGPDSHRQAALNLSLLRHVVLLFLMAPEQSRRTTRLR
jgi:hypothetical protein